MSRMRQMSSSIALGIVLYEAREWIQSLAVDIVASRGVVSSVIVVDNGQDSAGQELRSVVPEICLLENSTNLGHAHGVNQILAVAAEHLVLIADHDVRWKPGVILEMFEALRRGGDEHWAVTPVIRGKHGASSRTRSWSVGPFGTVCGSAATLRGANLGNARSVETSQRSDWFCPTTFVLFDRTRHEPKMVEEYFVYWNDVDLFLSAARRGYKLLAVSAEVWHGRGVAGVAYREGDRAPDLHEFYQTRNRWLFVLTNYKLWNLTALVPIFACIELGNLIHLARHKQFRIGLWAYVSVLQCVPAIFQIRRSKYWGDVSELSLIDPYCIGVAPARLSSLTRFEAAVLRGFAKLFGVMFQILRAPCVRDNMQSG